MRYSSHDGNKARTWWSWRCMRQRGCKTERRPLWPRSGGWAWRSAQLWRHSVKWWWSLWRTPGCEVWSPAQERRTKMQLHQNHKLSVFTVYFYESSQDFPVVTNPKQKQRNSFPGVRASALQILWHICAHLADIMCVTPKAMKYLKELGHAFSIENRNSTK